MLSTAAAFLQKAAPATDLDRRFISWGGELDELEAAPIADLTDAAAERMIDRCGELAELIGLTPAVSRIAATSKTRLLLADAAATDFQARALGDVLAYLVGEAA